MTQQRRQPEKNKQRQTALAGTVCRGHTAHTSGAVPSFFWYRYFRPSPKEGTQERPAEGRENVPESGTHLPGPTRAPVKDGGRLPRPAPSGRCQRVPVLPIRSMAERATSTPARSRRSPRPGPQLRAGRHQGPPWPRWRAAGRSPVPLHQGAPRARASSSTPSGDIWCDGILSRSPESSQRAAVLPILSPMELTPSTPSGPGRRAHRAQRQRATTKNSKIY